MSMLQNAKKWVVQHQVKVIGLGFVGLTYCRDHLTEVAHYLNPAHYAVISMGVGMGVALLDFMKKSP